MSDSKIARRSLKQRAPQFLQQIAIREENGVKTLECRVDGYPRPDVRWEKFGQPVGKSRRIHMTRSGDKCALQIKMPQPEDQGLYSCIASNILGMATTTTKIPTPYLGLRKLNGIAPKFNTSEIYTTRNENSFIEKSLLDSKSAKNKTNRSIFKIRSQSGSHTNHKESPNHSSKSKVTSFTRNLWNSSDSTDKTKTSEHIISTDKKRLCKSMEDCRKTKKSFLNRVKVPDIFKDNKTGVHHSVLHPSRKLNGAFDENGSTSYSEVSCSENNNINTEQAFNGVDEISNVEFRERNNTPLTTRERIAAYLKIFDSASSSKSKHCSSEKMPKRHSSCKNKTDDNKESFSTENESNFFSFAKFKRRKSSGDNSKKRHVERGLQTTSSSSEIYSQTLEQLRNTPLLNSTNENLLERNSISDVTGLRENKFSLDDGIECLVNRVDGMTSLQGNTDDIDLSNLSFKHIDVSLLSEIESFQVGGDELKDSYQNHENGVEETPNNTSSLSSAVPERRPNQAAHIAVPSIHIHLSSEDTSDDIIIGDNVEIKNVDELSNNIEHITTNIQLNGKTSLVLEEDVLRYDKTETTEVLEPDPTSPPLAVQVPARIIKGPQSVTVLRGESVTLAISFTGVPAPQVIWMKGGGVLRSSERLSILEGREMSVVTVSDVTADDSGKYVVSVQNDAGGNSCFASVAVVGIPEPPGGEPTTSEVTDHSLVLSWYGSMYDGGSVVTGYRVEMCTLPDKTWHKVASSVNTSCSVQGLSKGQRYQFKVRAENRYGVSNPSKESKIICLDDYLEESSEDEEPVEELTTVITVENGTEFSERFDLKEEVGKGRFGTVYRCVEKSCGRPRAAKIIRCLKAKDKEKVLQEIDVMSKLHHPKLMRVLAAFESGRNMIMVMEYISGGELFERVIADDFVLTERDCILFMRQICDGAAYMHKHNIIHLDLKPENILCKTRTSHKIKIIDFGLARYYKAEESLRVLFGTPEFVAPEVINYEPVCPASDMWSIGVICYVLISGLSPFMGDSDPETFANITRGEMDFDDEAFDDISNDAKDFISKLLVKQLRGRMSAEQCLTHPWLANESLVQKRPLSTEKLKRFIIRRKWQKSGTAIRALGRMVNLSRSSVGGSSCDSPLDSPVSSRSGSLLSRSETAESGDSEVFKDVPR